MPKDPEILAHQEWLGYVQPVGLVVSIPALVSAGAYINRNFAPDHRRFLEALPADKDGQPVSEIRDFAAFATSFFGWAASDLYGSPGAPGVPPSLEVALPEYSEIIRPTYALRDFQPSDSTREFLMLIQEFPPQTDFDAPAVADARQWQASPQAKFERLLRQTGIQIGLLVNGRQIRLVYAPEKELSGHITFNIGDMISVAGRPICSAMLMLLCSERLYIGSPEQRLPAILANSRKYQNVVSTQLAEQCWKPCTSCCALFRQPTIRQTVNCSAMSSLAIPTTSITACSPSSCASCFCCLRKTVGFSLPIPSTQTTTPLRGFTTGFARTMGGTPT